MAKLSINKPYQGRITNVNKHVEDNGNYFYTCKFLDHPQFAGMAGYTSTVVKDDGVNVETRNSKYTIVVWQDD